MMIGTMMIFMILMISMKASSMIFMEILIATIIGDGTGLVLIVIITVTDPLMIIKDTMIIGKMTIGDSIGMIGCQGIKQLMNGKMISIIKKVMMIGGTGFKVIKTGIIQITVIGGHRIQVVETLEMMIGGIMTGPITLTMKIIGNKIPVPM